MKDEELLLEAKDRYEVSSTGWSRIYNEFTDDMRFAYDVDGGQWPDEIRSERERSGRPINTVNKIQKFLRQIRGDQQQNRARIKTIPVDSKADVRMAGLYNDLIREIEYLSDASTVYDTAYACAIAGSIGYFRINTKYVDDLSFDQDITLQRIPNPVSIHFDPAAIGFMFEDAKYCFHEEWVDKKDFQKKYPSAGTQNFGSADSGAGVWLTDDQIQVMDYFYKEPVVKKIVQLQGGEVIELSKEITPEYITTNGGIIIKERTVETHKVMLAKITGTDVLKKEEWPGKYIPIIPVLGDEIIVNGKKYYLSLIRGAKDPQRMYNYHASAATEAIGLAPKSPFIVDHRQIKGFETEWAEANRTNRMFIRYNAVAGLNKPSRESQTEVPAGIMAMMQSTAFDIEDHLGRYEASKGQASNERSMVAIRERNMQSDKGMFVFVDNLTRSIIYAGRQLIDLIPKIYDTQRALRDMDQAGNQSMVEVNTPVMGPDGEIGVENDLTVGKYDLIATAGASYDSKRQEMVEMMVQAMQYAPDYAGLLVPLVFKYSDYPGSEEISAEITKGIQAMQGANGQTG